MRTVREQPVISATSYFVNNIASHYDADRPAFLDWCGCHA
jgi:hypothetical protein